MKEIASKILSNDYSQFKGNKIVHSLKIFAFGILIHAGFTILKIIAGNLELYERSPHPNAKTIASETSMEGLFIIFLVTVVATPITEELSFRLSNSKDPKKVLAGFSFMTVFVLLIFSKAYHIIPIHKELAFTLSFFTTSGLLYYVLSQVIPKFTVGNRQLAFILVFANVCFALAHLNISQAQPTFAGYLILLFPYVVSGYLFSYAALTMGLVYAILCHALINGFYFLLNII